MNVARRTVTKYRKRMGIPSSRQRRDWTLSKVKTGFAPIFLGQSEGSNHTAATRRQHLALPQLQSRRSFHLIAFDFIG